MNICMIFLIILIFLKHHECRGYHAPGPCVVYNLRQKLNPNTEINLKSEQSQKYFVQIWNCCLQIRITRPKDDQNTNIEIKYRNHQIDMQSLDKKMDAMTNNHFKKGRSLGTNVTNSVLHRHLNLKVKKTGWGPSQPLYYPLYQTYGQWINIIRNDTDGGNNLVEYIVSMNLQNAQDSYYAIINTIHSNGVQNPVKFKIQNMSWNQRCYA